MREAYIAARFDRHGIGLYDEPSEGCWQAVADFVGPIAQELGAKPADAARVAWRAYMHEQGRTDKALATRRHPPEWWTYYRDQMAFALYQELGRRAPSLSDVMSSAPPVNPADVAPPSPEALAIARGHFASSTNTARAKPIRGTAFAVS